MTNVTSFQEASIKIHASLLTPNMCNFTAVSLDRVFPVNVVFYNILHYTDIYTKEVNKFQCYIESIF
jgi:hypothetical protein